MILPLGFGIRQGDQMTGWITIGSLATGAVLFGVVQHVAIAPLMWVSLALLVHASRMTAAGAGLSLLYVALYTAMVIGNRGIIPVPGAAYYAVNAAMTLTMWLAFAADRLAGPRLTGVTATLVFPLAWTAIEFLRSHSAAVSTWGSIAYTQANHLTLMQVASVTGIWGVTFLMTWSASSIQFAAQRPWVDARVPVLVCASVVVAVLIGGAARLALAATDRPTIRMATVNRPVDLFAPGELTRLASDTLRPDERPVISAKLARLQDEMLSQTEREARAGAQVVAWPEVSVAIFAADEPAFLQRAQAVAAAGRIHLAMGMNTVHPGEKPPSENKLVLIDPEGRVVTAYEKSHPVVGWEASVIRIGAPDLPTVDTSIGRIAGAICNDASFPPFTRQAALKGADLLIEPANDWREIAARHFQMDGIRAIENGMPLLRPASSGMSGAFDPWGRVLAKADFFAAGERSITVQMPMGRIWTLYAQIGDVFAWLCTATLTAILLMAYMKK